MSDYDGIIEAVLSEVRPIAQRSPHSWERVAVEEIIPRHLQDPAGFFDWARQHRLWSFTVAECVQRVCAKPAELAIEVMRAIVEERLDEETN